jgi:hypothetical protein
MITSSLESQQARTSTRSLHPKASRRNWREYACVLIAERILQRKIEFYNSPAMERGLIVEAEAADWYEFDHDVTVQPVGFVTNDNHTIGCSPDRLEADDGLLEIKAPLLHTQIEYFR